MNNSANQLKAGVLLSYINTGAQIAIAIVYTPLMLRFLGQSEFGVYNLVYSIVSYLGLLSFGFGSSYIRFYSRFKADSNEEGIARLNGMFLIIFSIISIIAIIAGSLLTLNIESIFKGGLTPEEIQVAEVLMILMIVNIALTFPGSIFDAVVTAHEKYIFQRTLSLLRTVLNPFLALPLLLMGYRSISLAVVITILTLFALIINMWYSFKKLHVRFEFRQFDFHLFKEMWIFSFYIFLNMIIDQINWNVDKFILGKFRGSAEVAVYSISAQINALYLTISTAVSSVFIPRINKMVTENNGNKQLTDLFVRVGRIQFIILSMVLSGFIFFGEYFIKIWAGQEFKETYVTAYLITLWLIIPATISLIQNIGIEIQRAKNKHRFRSILYILIAAGNLLVSIPLSQIYGGIGCAAATGIALFIGNGLIMNWYYHKHIGLDILLFWKQILRFGPGLFIPALLGFILKAVVGIDSIGKLLGFGFSYSLCFVLSVWFISMNDTEKALFKAPFKKIILKIMAKGHKFAAVRKG